MNRNLRYMKGTRRLGIKLPALSIPEKRKTISDPYTISCKTRVIKDSIEDLNKVLTPVSSFECTFNFTSIIETPLEKYFNGENAQPSPKRWYTPDFKKEKPSVLRHDKRKYSLDYQSFDPVRSETPSIDKRNCYRGKRRKYPKILRRFEKPMKSPRIPRVGGMRGFNDYIVSNVGSRISNTPINIIKKLKS